MKLKTKFQDEIYWYIESDGEVMDDRRSWHIGQSDNEWEQEKEAMKRIGNYFETREEAEKAVEKLKALKRLKEKGIFVYLDHLDFRLQEGSLNFEFPNNNLTDEEMTEVDKDLDLLFGGEE